MGGLVTDQSGAVVANATITITNTATNATRTSHTSSNGTYLIAALEPGTYRLEVISPNFKPFSANLEVIVGAHVTLDIKLSVSSNITEVEVVGAGGVAVNTQSQELSQVVSTDQLANLPSLTRNPYDFIAISGNVSSGDNTTNSSNSGQNLTSRGVGYSINGQRQSGTEILLGWRRERGCV